MIYGMPLLLRFSINVVATLKYILLLAYLYIDPSDALSIKLTNFIECNYKALVNRIKPDNNKLLLKFMLL